MIKIKDGENVKVYRNLPEQVAKNQRDIEDLANQTDTEVEALKGRVTTTEEDIEAIKDGTNIDSFKDVEEALDLKADKSTTYTKTEVEQLLSSKINIQSIEVTGGSGTLTPEQLADLVNSQNIMIKRANVLYYKAFENDTIIEFERVNFNRSSVNGVQTTVAERIRITKSTAEWDYNNVIDIQTYTTEKVDELIAGAGGGLDLLWETTNSTAAVESLNILFDHTQYKGIIIEMRVGAGNTTTDQKKISQTIMFNRGTEQSSFNTILSYTDTAGVLWTRDCNLYDAGFHISNGIKYAISTGTKTTFQSTALIPQAVYGLK